MECVLDENAIDDEITFLLRLRPSPTPPVRKCRSVDFKRNNCGITNGWDVMIERREVITPSPPPVPPRRTDINSLQPSAPPQEVVENQSVPYKSGPYQQYYQHACTNSDLSSRHANLQHAKQTYRAPSLISIDQDYNTTVTTHSEQPPPFVTNHNQYLPLHKFQHSDAECLNTQLNSKHNFIQSEPKMIFRDEITMSRFTPAALNISNSGVDLISSYGVMQQSAVVPDFQGKTSLSQSSLKPPKPRIPLRKNNYTLTDTREDLINLQSDSPFNLVRRAWVSFSEAIAEENDPCESKNNNFTAEVYIKLFSKSRN
ncbi:hypothetical protein FQR65_LT11866 [Abscondita terminalis]|nr:hypothetical protein FQR65_LT11866 [Abscondita terminalis]